MDAGVTGGNLELSQPAGQWSVENDLPRTEAALPGRP